MNHCLDLKYEWGGWWGVEGASPVERFLLNHKKTSGFLASRGEEFNLGPEMGLDGSELLCNNILLKYKGNRKSF